jgi:hypothetical protein
MYDSSLDQFAKKLGPVTLDRYVYNSISYRNKLGLIKPGPLRNTTLYRPIIIDKRTQLMWFGFNFSDAKDYATIAQYQNSSRNKIKTKTQTRFPAIR